MPGKPCTNVQIYTGLQDILIPDLKVTKYFTFIHFLTFFNI